MWGVSLRGLPFHVRFSRRCVVCNSFLGFVTVFLAYAAFAVCSFRISDPQALQRIFSGSLTPLTSYIFLQSGLVQTNLDSSTMPFSSSHSANVFIIPPKLFSFESKIYALDRVCSHSPNMPKRRTSRRG